jgi:hypothetical protein
VHDSVRDSVNPFPEFEVHTVKLDSGKAVLIIAVPEGLDAPYIHADGTVYRRQQSSSDPLVENNRFTIDELYARKKILKEELDRFRSVDYGFNKGEDNQPFLVTYVNLTPFNAFLLKDFFSADRLDSVKGHFSSEFRIEDLIDGERRVTMSGSMKIDQAMFYENSISLRYLSQQNLSYHSISIELFSNGNIKILQPLQTVGYPERNDAEFGSLLTEKGLKVESPVTYIPLSSICSPLIGVIQRYLDLLSIEEYSGRIEFSFETMNCYRTIVYSNTLAYRSHVRRFGIPLCMKPRQVFPIVPNKILVADLLSAPTLSLFEIVKYVLQAFGMPSPDSVNVAIQDMQTNQNAV